MTFNKLKLMPGVDPAYARQVLEERIQKASNIASVAVGTLGVFVLRDAYVEWVDDTERQLQHLTYDHDVLTMLDTSRYHLIRTLGSNSSRPWPLVQGEIALQTKALERLSEDLAERTARLRAAPGDIAVLDTHVLLHFLPPDQVPWVDVVKKPAVRLILPLRVVEELDAKKYARRGDLAGRARAILRQLRKLTGAAGTPATLQPGVTIEVLIEPGPRDRPTDADEEILTACRELVQFSGKPVRLVTADTAMQMRAEAQETAVIEIADRWQRNRDD